MGHSAPSPVTWQARRLGRDEDLGFVPAVLAAAVLIAATASAAPGNVGFGFNARDISGFPTGAA